MARKKIEVKQEPENPVHIVVLANAIVDIADGIRKMRAGPLNDKALLLLIQHSAPTRNRQGQRYGLSEIKDILDGIEDLAATYLKKKGA